MGAVTLAQAPGRQDLPRKIWGRRWPPRRWKIGGGGKSGGGGRRSSLVRQEADLGAEAPPSGLARAATAVFRGKGGEEL